MVMCFLFFQSLIPIASQAQGTRIRQANQTAENKKVEQTTVDEGESQDSDADNPEGREEWFRSGRHAAGEHTSDLLHRAYVQKQQMSVNSQGAAQQSATTLSIANPAQNTASGFTFNGATYPGTWTNLGPAPIGSDSGQDYGKVVGRVTSVAVDQGDTSGNIIYIGAAFGGVWKSTNAAASDPTTVKWIPLIDDQPTLAVGAVSVQPGTTGNAAIVLVGTGEPNSSGDSYYGMGILRSANGGAAGSWTLIKSADSGVKTFAGLGVSKFAWSTANPNLVVVGMGSTNGKRYGSDSLGGRGIYYSQDAGQTWHYATVQDPGGATLTEGTVTDIAYNPGTGKFYAFYRYHGFYESADGVTWARSAFQPQSIATPNLTIANCPTSQPTNPNPTGTCPLYRGQISIQPTTHEMYVIYVNDTDIHQGVFVTSSGAATAWREITSKGSAGLVDTSSTNAIVQGDYNLWLGTIATSQGTDLLIGTRNIHKCSLTGTPADCTTTWKNLTHVYDCNPIAQPSHVHPDQHGFDFNITNPLQMFFVNDGGVYRSLNGANGDGSCNAQQVFDNLDANIGSLSEMVSFSQHPTNQNVLLGGLQDNGSPALLGSATLLWQTVNGGDGGFNEIDPNNPDGIWYATNTGVSIQQCDATNKQAAPNGPNIPNAEACTPGTFGAAPYPALGPNIGPAQVANDTAEFYMPYVLDPANTSNLILGTCRLWRGPGVGGSAWFDANASANKDVSPIFDTAKTTCVSGTTKVRAIAAGGPAPNGASQVIYVGLEGAGTVGSSGGNLGHVFVDTQADVNTGTHGAANNWVDVTPNPGATLTTSGGTYGPYPVSSIEIDRHDPSGKTAYVTVEGFGVSHVFKTINAGQSWIDLSNNLPDAPVDSIAVDPDDPNVLYVGTDVGSFISTNGGAVWQVLGTNLPNVPVTKIRVFSYYAAQPTPLKAVRVSTYGRGVWQFPMAQPTPLAVSPASLSGFTDSVQNPSQAQTITVSNTGPVAASINGINFSTGFSQNGGDCSPGTSLAPAGSSTSSCTIAVIFTATTPGATSGTVAVTDSVGASHSVNLSGTASDFAISAATASMTVNAGQAATYNLNASAIGGFSNTVTFACTGGLPTGANCAFSPSGSVTVSGATPTAVTLTISTTARPSSQPAPSSGLTSLPFSSNGPGAMLTITLGLLGTLLMKRLQPVRGRVRGLALVGVMAGVALVPGCGGGSSVSTTSFSSTTNGTPANTYTVTVTASSGKRNIATQLTLKVN
ncbi:MAG: hypothetical protein DMG60_07505 [Acidobacteria bacterium]|nr:MAG: hypothetical protein DMG60_07505 [Acidobacteriota bacterium]